MLIFKEMASIVHVRLIDAFDALCSVYIPPDIILETELKLHKGHLVCTSPCAQE